MELITIGPRPAEITGVDDDHQVDDVAAATKRALERHGTAALKVVRCRETISRARQRLVELEADLAQARRALDTVITSASGLTIRDRIIDALPGTAADIALRTGLSDRQVVTNARNLVLRGLIDRTGHGRDTVFHRRAET